MAIRYAIANGNWSSTASWDGFTLPTAADDIYADGKIISINQNIIVNSLTTRPRSGGLPGGQFVVNNISGLFITASEIVSGITDCLRVNLLSSQVINIKADINNATYSTYGAFISGGVTNLTGTVSCGSKSSGTGNHYAMYSQSGVLNMNGNIYGGTPSSSTNAIGLYLNNHRINLIGDMIGGNGSNCFGLYALNNSAIYATGSVRGGEGSSSFGLYSIGNNNILRTIGNFYGGSGINAFAANYITSGDVEIIGDILAGTGPSSGGISVGSGVYVGRLTVTGSIYAGTNTNCYGSQIFNINGGATIAGNIFAGNNNSSNGTIGLWISGAMNTTINGNVYASASIGLRSQHSGGTTTLNGRAISSLNYGLYHNALGNMIINGTQSNNGGGGSIPIYKEFGSGNMTINGNIIGVTSSNLPSLCIYDNSQTTLTINGNVTNGDFGASNGAGLVYLFRASTLNINGNVSGGTVPNALAVFSNTSFSTMRINVIGDVIGGANPNNCMGISLGTGVGSQILTVTGSVIASSQSVAISSPNVAHLTTIHGNIVNNSNVMAFFGVRLNIGTTQSTTWTLQTSSGSRAISTSNASNGVPAVSNVRSGVVYGSGNEFTGTLAVPTASMVSFGVPVDNTTGTAVLNVSDVGALLAGYVV